MKTEPLPSVHIAPAENLPPGWQPGQNAGWTASMPPLTAAPIDGGAESISLLMAAVAAVIQGRPTDDEFPIHVETDPQLRLTATFHDLQRVAQELEGALSPGPELAGAVRDALPPAPLPSAIATSRGELRFDGPPLLMGVVNVTPDSFSDGGLYLEPEAAFRRAWELIEQGAGIIDVGAESTRPGADPVSAKEELKRILPVLTRLAPGCPVPISVDTYKAEVAEVALGEGADVINDISGFTFDPSLPYVVARHGAPIILAHTLGRPKTMQQDPRYRWLAADVIESLAASVRKAGEAGISMGSCLVDPGLGFGKTFAQNEELIEALPVLKRLGLPVVLGPSRKAFIAARWGDSPDVLIEGTVAVCRRAAALGASVLRVHEVGEVRRALEKTSAGGNLAAKMI